MTCPSASEVTLACLVLSLSLFLLSCQSTPTGETAELSSRPNVVLILADDQGWGDLSLHGNPYLETPHIDRLAQNGLQHANFYVNPLCAPTRASLLTGRYNLRTGTRWVSNGLENMRPEEFTLAELFKSADYATGCFGKWHNGAHYPFHPNQQGFDEFIGFCAGHWNNYFNTTLEHNGEPYPTEGYITDVLTDEALRFIEENQDQPFFCYVPYNTPHGPFQVADPYYDKYYQQLDTMQDEQARAKLASVYGMCENIDDNVGRITGLLDSLELAENTIVIYLSDNGPNGTRYNGGMRGTKSSVHEGGVRVPALVRWPARISAGEVREAVAAHIDLFPTLATLCQIPLPDSLQLDGIDLADWWVGERSELPDRTLFVQQSDQELTPERGAVRTAEYRYVLYPGYTGLYHLPTDPGEEHNLTTERPALADSLRAMYADWFAAMQAAREDYTLTPVGFVGQKVVTLPAHESQFSGEIHYQEGHGWAHDWLVNWTRSQDSIWWNVRAEEAGIYEAIVTYTCSESDVGSRIQLTSGKDQVSKIISQAYDPEYIPSPDRIPRIEVYEKEWAQQSLGTIELAEGQQRLVLRATSVAHQEVAELKNLTLKKVTTTAL